MKRFRVLSFDFDTRATVLNQEIRPEREPSVRQLWEENIASIQAGLQREFGELNADAKLQNFIDLGPRPFSILAFHNGFSAQARNAFVVGAYYPALTGACALGERMLNHLILRLREYFRSTDEYKRVYRKDSFDRWQVPITTLSSWGVLLPESAQAFTDLEEVRNRAIHFHPDTDKNDRTMALEAIRILDRIITVQFPMMGLQPWFIPDTPGESYISREWEHHPFIREVYLPNCLHVGPEHSIEQLFPKLIVRDRDDYPDTAISDARFRELRTGGASSAAPDA